MKGFSELVLTLFAVAVMPVAQAADSRDQKFVADTAITNLAEIEAGNIARDKASQDSVRKYAEHLVSDHQQATEKLKSLASQKGLQLPADADAKHKRELDDLSKKSGADFDKAYVNAMVKDHKATIKRFEKQAKDGKDPELKSFAAETLPTLKKHLQEAQQLQGGMKGAKKAS